eukprot:m.779671 g.779671  ORF g.779671 m.779671 type:complete len:858 (+) comp23279_c0_seq6:470-3043(+)
MGNKWSCQPQRDPALAQRRFSRDSGRVIPRKRWFRRSARVHPGTLNDPESPERTSVETSRSDDAPTERILAETSLPEAEDTHTTTRATPEEAAAQNLLLPLPDLLARGAYGGLSMRGEGTENDDGGARVPLGSNQPRSQLGVVRSQRRGLALPPIGGSHVDEQRLSVMAPAGRLPPEQPRNTHPTAATSDSIRTRLTDPTHGSDPRTPPRFAASPTAKDITDSVGTPGSMLEASDGEGYMEGACGDHSVRGPYDTPRRKSHPHRNKRRQLPAVHSRSGALESASRHAVSSTGGTSSQERDHSHDTSLKHQNVPRQEVPNGGAAGSRRVSAELDQRTRGGEPDTEPLPSELPRRKTPSDLPPRGATVELHSLRSASYNGQQGTVHGHDPDGTRCIVRLFASGEKRNIKIKNIRVVNAPSQLRGRRTRDSLRLNVNAAKLPLSTWTVDSNSDLPSQESDPLDATWDTPPDAVAAALRTRQNHDHSPALRKNDGDTSRNPSVSTGLAVADTTNVNGVSQQDSTSVATSSGKQATNTAHRGADGTDTADVSTPPRTTVSSTQRRPATPYVRHQGTTDGTHRTRSSTTHQNEGNGNGVHESDQAPLEHATPRDLQTGDVCPRAASSDGDVAGAAPLVKSILRQISHYAAEDDKQPTVEVPQYGYDFVMNNCLLYKDEVLQNTRANSVVAPILRNGNGMRFSMRRRKSAKRRIRFPDEGSQNSNLVHTQEFDKEDMVMHLLDGKNATAENNAVSGNVSVGASHDEFLVGAQGHAVDEWEAADDGSNDAFAEDDDGVTGIEAGTNVEGTDARAESPDANDTEPSAEMSKRFNTTIRLSDLRQSGNGLYDFSYMNGDSLGNELFV